MCLNVTFLILAHDSVTRVCRLVEKILREDPDCKIVVHFDKKSGDEKYNVLKKKLSKYERCHVLANRISCGWGQWSLVEATLKMLRYAQQTCKADYYYLLSEHCYPTQPLSELKKHLSHHYGTNFIECEDSSWIKGGIREDRYLYWHFLNKRKYPSLHRWTYKCQKWLGLKRRVPDGLTIKFGSQWWCLTQEAIDFVLDREPRYRSFFKWVWIPDECFFSSVVALDKETSKPLTYYEFNEKGMPKVWSGVVHQQGFFFVRKYV
ncbi:beta-1,6-N-acetylglucosaminyltransferase [Vreelandella populi]|uniref:Peptide O-xylosyltransferase n=1 Tax=Vreelandella populi TaxID=2498858 RepID=A0A3S0YM65_9GAMM|nr:beta-1,6-N-acetylglucosaminyltransferase [Halomonas populi]RUR46005.1 hypothetical protein ELY37_08370 [Halomonas populi]